MYLDIWVVEASLSVISSGYMILVTAAPPGHPGEPRTCKIYIPQRGIEPPRLSTLDSKSSAPTNYATVAKNSSRPTTKN